MGYYGTCIPHTILRNMFENPGWTTQVTVQYSAVQYSTVQYSTVQYSTGDDLVCLVVAGPLVGAQQQLLEHLAAGLQLVLLPEHLSAQLSV